MWREEEKDMCVNEWEMEWEENLCAVCSDLAKFRHLANFLKS